MPMCHGLSWSPLKSDLWVNSKFNKQLKIEKLSQNKVHLFSVQLSILSPFWGSPRKRAKNENILDLYIDQVARNITKN